MTRFRCVVDCNRCGKTIEQESAVYVEVTHEKYPVEVKLSGFDYDGERGDAHLCPTCWATVRERMSLDTSAGSGGRRD